MRKRCRVIAAAVAAGVMLMAQPAQAAGGMVLYTSPVLVAGGGNVQGAGSPGSGAPSGAPSEAPGGAGSAQAQGPGIGQTPGMGQTPGGDQYSGGNQAPDGSQAPGVSQTPGGSQYTGVSQTPVGSQYTGGSQTPDGGQAAPGGGQAVPGGSQQTGSSQAPGGSQMNGGGQAPSGDQGVVLSPVVTAGGKDQAAANAAAQQAAADAAAQQTAADAAAQQAAAEAAVQQSGGRRVDPSKPMVALTFDDGPQPSVGNRIMDCLAQYGGKATFFMVGDRVASRKTEVQRMVAEGHEVANHTMNHKYLQKLGAAEIQVQVTKCNDAIEAACGVRPKVMRLPGGNHNATVLANTHMPMIQWNIDTLDWKTRNAQKTVDAVLNHVKDGDIILMHELYSQSGDAALQIIPELTRRGYQLVTVSEMAAAKGHTLQAGKLYSSFR